MPRLDPNFSRVEDPRGTEQMLRALEANGPEARHGPGRRRFSLYGASFEVDRGEDALAAAESARVYSTNQRRHPRVPLNGRVRFGPKGPVAGLIDINADGFAARVHPAARHRIPGYAWVEIVLGRDVIAGYARLRRTEERQHHIVLGFELEPEHERVDVVRNILEHAFPSIIPRADLPPNAVSRLLMESGYLDLCEDGGLPEAWLAFRDPRSFDLVAVGDDATPVAHLSITKAFSTTWVAHQLASRSTHNESFWSWYQLHRYLACLPAMMDGANAHVVAYYNPSQPYHQRYLRAFGGWMRSEDDVVIAQANMFHLDAASDDVAAPESLDEWSVSLLTSHDREAAHRIAMQNMRPLVARAFDITPSTLETADLTRSTGDLERARRVFVLRRRGEVLAIALCERGHSAISIFGLFDLVYVLPSRDGLVVPQRAIGMLMEAARGFYRTEGVDRALVFAPVGYMISEAHPALEYSHVVERFIMGGHALRHYENFVRYTFGRAARAVKRKMKWKER
ncbi:MAG: hypothetical protein RMA76_26730 [Deltaproteobacteria bacterium]|jgi:hypothetical protein